MEIIAYILWFLAILATINITFDLWYQEVGGDITYVRTDELKQYNRGQRVW